MGNCSGSGNPNLRPDNKRLLYLYGDYLNSDTRTIIAILKMCQIPYDLNYIDTLQNQHKKEFYT